MPVPKKNHSHHRQAIRRANWKGALPTIVACKNCGEMHKSHNICEACGYYNGRQYKEVALTGPTEAQG